MATSVLKQCVTAVVKVKRFSPSFSARRWLLSAAYTDTTAWEARTKHPHTLAKLAAFMDSIYERNFPVSSLTMSRFVDSITSREEVDQAEYYLYKFRHSPNCWYLRDWTIHSWVRQCLKYGAREKALYTLKNKVQYGIFPDDFTFNLLIDSCIKDGDFQNACSVVEEVMLQEAFDLPSTQILSLYTLGTFLSIRPQLTVSQQRGLGASLLLCGLNQENTVGLNAQLLGNTLLGKVEFFEGIHAVFRGMPLFWGRGYLGRALAVMEKVSAAASGDIKLSKDTLDYVSDMLQELSSTSDSESSGEESEGDEDKKTEDAVDEDDQAERARLPQYISRFKELNSLLESQGKVESSTFKDIVTDFAQQNLAAAEKRDMEEFEERLQTWEAEERQLTQREKEMRAIAEQEKREQLAKAAARAAARAAAQQA